VSEFSPLTSILQTDISFSQAVEEGADLIHLIHLRRDGSPEDLTMLLKRRTRAGRRKNQKVIRVL